MCFLSLAVEGALDTIKYHIAVIELSVLSDKDLKEINLSRYEIPARVMLAMLKSKGGSRLI